MREVQLEELPSVAVAGAAASAAAAATAQGGEVDHSSCQFATSVATWAGNDINEVLCFQGTETNANNNNSNNCGSRTPRARSPLQEVEIVFEGDEAKEEENRLLAAALLGDQNNDNPSAAVADYQQDDDDALSEAVLAGGETFWGKVSGPLDKEDDSDYASSFEDDGVTTNSCSDDYNTISTGTTTDEEEKAQKSDDEEEVMSDDSGSFNEDNFDDNDDHYAGGEANGWTDLTKPEVLMLEESDSDEETRQPVTTVLSKKLWERDYQTVEERILSHPHEVSTMIDIPGTDEPVVQGFPLHLACALRPFPPLSIFQLLLSVYPKAAQQTETQWGMLPLHFASNLTSQRQGSSIMDLELDDNHLGVVETLLSANPDAVITKELCQGRTPFHLAASSTLQSFDGMIPSTSHAILQALMMTMRTMTPTPTTSSEESLLWTMDSSGFTAYDIAESKSKRSCVLSISTRGSLVEMEMGWKLNPLLMLTPPVDDTRSSDCDGAAASAGATAGHATKKLVVEDASDATSVTDSLSSGSFTSGYTLRSLQHQLEVDRMVDTLSGVEEEEENKKKDDDDESLEEEEPNGASSSDDDSFYTARSHEQSTVRADNCHEAELQWDDSSVLQLTASVPKPPGSDMHEEEDDAHSIWTLENDDANSVVDRSTSTTEPPTDYSQSTEVTTALVASAATTSTRPYIPRAVQVDKVLLHLQLYASDLVRLRTTKKTSSIFAKSLFSSSVKKKVNPYFEVELLHCESDIGVQLHTSQPYYQRREALWEPVRFAIDATMARSLKMVLSINLYHKGQKSKGDEFIGGHQASPWDLRQSDIDKIPLKRQQNETGNLRLVSYRMESLNKADCWRIYW